MGTLYKQESPFAARKVGATLVARNIAQHLETTLNQYPKSWRPLIYCWRGGQRSGAFTHILREIGWPAKRLEGGYKSWRRHVLENLQTLPGDIRFLVIAGPTGSAKSRLLEALAAQGAQILHLEQLSAHKGSVLGGLPDTPQPTQKKFETLLYSTLSSVDPARPVFVEAESRQIGIVRLPESLIRAIRSATCVSLEASLAARVSFLLQDYDYLCEPGCLDAQLLRLKEIQGKERILRWQELTQAGDFRTLVTELLVEHYDPLYLRSQSRNFAQLSQATTYVATDLSPTGLRDLAKRILSELEPQPDASSRS